MIRLQRGSGEVHSWEMVNHSSQEAQQCQSAPSPLLSTSPSHDKIFSLLLSTQSEEEQLN